MGRAKNTLSKSNATVRIPTFLREQAQAAKVNLSQVLVETLPERLDPLTYAPPKIEALRRENEEDIARLAELDNKIAARHEKIAKLEKLLRVNKLAVVLGKIRNLIGWYFDGDIAMALQAIKSEGLDAEYEALVHKPLDQEKLTAYVRYWNEKEPSSPDPDYW